MQLHLFQTLDVSWELSSSQAFWLGHPESLCRSLTLFITSEAGHGACIPVPCTACSENPAGHRLLGLPCPGPRVCWRNLVLNNISAVQIFIIVRRDLTLKGPLIACELLLALTSAAVFTQARICSWNVGRQALCSAGVLGDGSAAWLHLAPLTVSSHWALPEGISAAVLMV